MVRLLVAMILTVAASVCAANTAGRMGDVSVIDRDTGATLPLHWYRGEYWVAGVPGARYAIEIHNRTGERLLAVTSVDGVNVVSGQTAAWDQTGYVFDPGERYQISGWRKSDTDVAAFTFTALPNSYAARTGRPANVGVIGVALFREQLPVKVAPRESLSDRAPGAVPAPSNAPAAAPTTRDGLGLAAAAAASARSLADEAAVTAQRAETTSPAPRVDPETKLGTGHGAREYSYVMHTEFVRLKPQPNELIRIRYDSVENLVAMGVIRRPPSAGPELHGGDPFPGSSNRQYVPDPPG